MRTTTIHLPGDVSVDDRAFFGGPDGHTVGSAGLWDDDSDASYAEIYVTCHPDSWVADTAFCLVQSLSLPPMQVDKVSVVTRVRVQAITSTGAEGAIAAEFFPTPAVRAAAGSTPAAPSGATAWHEVPMAFASQADFDSFLTRVADGTLSVHVFMIGTRAVTDFTYPGARVFEVQVLIYQPGGYAPPCRNIKRGDVLDLGGARNYPPSKMQQTSSRGVGAY